MFSKSEGLSLQGIESAFSADLKSCGRATNEHATKHDGKVLCPSAYPILTYHGAADSTTALVLTNHSASIPHWALFCWAGWAGRCREAYICRPLAPILLSLVRASPGSQALRTPLVAAALVPSGPDNFSCASHPSTAVPLPPYPWLNKSLAPPEPLCFLFWLHPQL